jgi:phosphatidylglycerophosphatase C
VSKIAFFDFDGTITTHDTMLELVKFHAGNKAYYKGMIKLLPSLIGMKLHLISNQEGKEKLLQKFFKGITINDFQSLCYNFITKRLPQLIRPEAIKMIKKLQSENVQVVVVSASADNWVKPWCDNLGITLLGSCLEVKNNLITGKLNGPNCNHHQKVIRIKEQYQLSDFSEIYCYGDTKGDKPMLELATQSFYKPFRT